MQPAEEVFLESSKHQELASWYRELHKHIDVDRKIPYPEFIFLHTKRPSESIAGANTIYLGKSDHLSIREDVFLMPYVKTVVDLKDWILSQPKLKGTLIDIRYKVITYSKFHCKLYTSKELFNLRFDRSKIKTLFHEWLWEKIRAIYDAWDGDDPRKDPLHGKREMLWHEALTQFRIYHQSTHAFNELPKLSYEWISFQTLKDNIDEIRTISKKDC